MKTFLMSIYAYRRLLRLKTFFWNILFKLKFVIFCIGKYLSLICILKTDLNDFKEEKINLNW